MSKSKMFLSDLYPLVTKSLSDPKNQKKLIEGVGRYTDRHSSSLTTPGPSTRPSFTDEDKGLLFEVCGVSKETVKEILKSNPAVKAQWSIINEPFVILIVMATRYAAVTRNEKLENALVVYLMLSLYPFFFTKYFKFNPNEQVMAYTIANMSNKFKVKQSGTIYRAMYETVDKCYDLQKPHLISGTDQEFVNYVMDVRTRMNSLMKNIGREFYHNHTHGLYLNSDGDSYDENNFYEADSNIYAVDRLTNKVTLGLVVDGPDMTNVTLAARLAQVSVNELRNYTIALVNSDRREQIRQLIEAIVTTYIVDGQKRPEEVSRNNEFLLHANALYKKSNTSDKNVIKIKSILDEWIEDLDVYKKTQRQATINNFRRSIYLFFVISIMKLA